ncbi:fumarylacetoacetate hydrolase family protein [Kribbella sp. NBC_01484]|uniref:fumarylacetoacetate hydrolase family protein n=1 Tax=Kribbella sp. NBC_01484 TaxID=2903579 RepID=UPI002E317C16|nr:fumarylacetoacetate hydrolase family protein [Kribbella sp. NBC_01484]
MRTANLDGRLVLMTDSGAVDVSVTSSGRFGSDPQSALEQWDELREWAATVDLPGEPVKESLLGPPVPRPRQVFGIGMNYASHAAESGMEIPLHPATFTKFPTCITGPNATVVLPSEKVDWEVELVAVIGRRAWAVDEADAMDHIAGFTVGQDLSERGVQWRKPHPQFSLGKSFPGFGPIGPSLVTIDELSDPHDLAITATLNGETIQTGRTSDLIFSVPRLVAELSSIVALLPGDLIFTGTPSGVGATRSPQRFLQPGDELISTIEGIGSILTTFGRGQHRRDTRMPPTSRTVDLPAEPANSGAA